MAKRRSTLKGRGAEILFGEPAPVEIAPVGIAEPVPKEPLPPQPESGDLPAEETPPPVEEPVLDDADLDLFLAEEMEAISPSTADKEATMTSPAEEEPTLSPEDETALFHEAMVAEEPSDPAVEDISPPPEVTMEEQELQEEVAISAPPPEEEEVSEDLLPARTVTGYFDMGDLEPLATYDVQEPEEEVEPLELPEMDLSPEEEEKLLRRWGAARLREMEEEIAKTYEQVLSKVGENEDIATDCYNKLLKARDILMRREAARLPQAEYYLAQVRARLKRATESEVKAKKYAWKITAWGFLWVIVFLGALITLNLTEVIASANSLWGLQADIEIGIFLSAMLWGGLGGVVAVWYSLFKHVGRRDFDSQYNLSYVGKPFLGLVLGATVYMLFHLMMTLGILPAGLQQEGGDSLALVTPWIIYPVAWAAGFKENRIFDLVDRVMKRIFSGEEKEEIEAPPPLEPTT